MKVYNFELGPIAVNSFLIIPDSGGAVLIDAPEGAFEAANEILKGEGKKLEAVLLTHGHWDHMWDTKKLQDGGAKVYAHPDGSALIENAGSQNSYMFSNAELESAKINVKLFDGQQLKFGDAEFEVRIAPGHCPGSAVFYMKDKNAAFVGDVIFAQSVGRYDLPGGDYKTLENSIREKIYTLPDETVLYPGHGPATKVILEKQSNPFVRG